MADQVRRLAGLGGALDSLDAVNRLMRQVGGVESVLSMVDVHRRLLGPDIRSAVGVAPQLARGAVPSAGVLAAATEALAAADTRSAVVAQALRPVAATAFELFDGPGWQGAFAEAEQLSRMAAGSDAFAAAVSLGASVDVAVALAGRLDALSTTIPAPVLASLEDSYAGWASAITGLPRTPEFAPVWRTRVAAEVPLRLTAAAVAVTAPPDEGGAVDAFDIEGDADGHDVVFDDGFGDRLVVSLGTLHPTLPARLRAARDALERDDERAAAQAANELVELVNHTIRLAASDDEVRAWHREQAESTTSPTPAVTRALRVRYLASLSPAAAVAQAQVDPLETMLRYLQDVKHALDAPPVEPVRLVVPAVEAVLTLLVGARSDESRRPSRWRVDRFGRRVGRRRTQAVSGVAPRVRRRGGRRSRRRIPCEQPAGTRPARGGPQPAHHRDAGHAHALSGRRAVRLGLR